jgi:hypothetical protein
MVEATEIYTLTQFNEDDPKWYIVNDGVMGGLSDSNMKLTDRGTAVFEGSVSLKNNGGFASTRMPLPNPAPAGLNFIRLKVKGDGNRYNFRIRNDRSFDGLAYDLAFDTQKEEWIEVELPLDKFQGTFRGRRFSDKIGVDSQNIGQIGILIANKQEGEFTLEIDWIELRK